MAYIITGDTLGLAIGPVSETANNVHEALNKARQMYETGPMARPRVSPVMMYAISRCANLFQVTSPAYPPSTRQSPDIIRDDPRRGAFVAKPSPVSGTSFQPAYQWCRVFRKHLLWS